MIINNIAFPRLHYERFRSATYRFPDPLNRPLAIPVEKALRIQTKSNPPLTLLLEEHRARISIGARPEDCDPRLSKCFNHPRRFPLKIGYHFSNVHKHRFAAITRLLRTPQRHIARGDTIPRSVSVGIERPRTQSIVSRLTGQIWHEFYLSNIVFIRIAMRY